MTVLRRPVWKRTLAILNIWTLFFATNLLQAQTGDAPPPKLGANELDTVVARIALYPDPLLAQVMAASSFSDQIPEAYQWSTQHKNLKGDDLTNAMEKANLVWDPSVQALLPFPSVLQQMNQDPAWTAKLGGAVLAQRGDVMDAVQRMRKKA
jgi:hypothetical protein